LAGQLLIWVLNRNRVTNRSNVATQLLTAEIAVALPNSITRKRPPQRGFVQVRFAAPNPVCHAPARLTLQWPTIPRRLVFPFPQDCLRLIGFERARCNILADAGRVCKIARTCFVGPRLFVVIGGRTADLQNRFALHCLSRKAQAGAPVPPTLSERAGTGPALR